MTFLGISLQFTEFQKHIKTTKQLQNNTLTIERLTVGNHFSVIFIL